MRRPIVAGAVVAAFVAAGMTAAIRSGGGDGGRAAAARGPELFDVLGDTGAHPPDVAVGFAAGAGRIVTVAHILDGGRPVRVRGGREPPREATVVGLDPRLDVAVLATEAARGARAAGLAPGAGRRAAVVARAAPGERARLLVRRAGRTVALRALVRRRVTLRVARPQGGPPLRRPGLVLAAGVRPGDSGAPLVDDAGRVTGIVFARSREKKRTAYAVEPAGLERLLRGTTGPDARAAASGFAVR